VGATDFMSTDCINLGPVAKKRLW